MWERKPISCKQGCSIALITECLFIQLSEWVNEWERERERGRQLSWLPPPPTIHCFPSFHHITVWIWSLWSDVGDILIVWPDFTFRSARSLSYWTPIDTILVDPARRGCDSFRPKAASSTENIAKLTFTPALTATSRKYRIWFSHNSMTDTETGTAALTPHPKSTPANLATNTTTTTITTTVLSLMMLQGLKV